MLVGYEESVRAQAVWTFSRLVSAEANEARILLLNDKELPADLGQRLVLSVRFSSDPKVIAAVTDLTVSHQQGSREAQPCAGTRI